MIGLEGRLAARRQAPVHVQLELAPFAPTPRIPSEIQIEGRAVRVFRGDAVIHTGASVRFALWVCERGDEPTGLAFVYYKDLVAASYMETYLYGTPPNCKLAAHEFELLERPSGVPAMSVDQLKT